MTDYLQTDPERPMTFWQRFFAEARCTFFNRFRWVHGEHTEACNRALLQELDELHARRQRRLQDLRNEMTEAESE